jgi:hypothetical protein
MSGPARTVRLFGPEAEAQAEKDRREMDPQTYALCYGEIKPLTPEELVKWSHATTAYVLDWEDFETKVFTQEGLGNPINEISQKPLDDNQ